MGRSVTAECGLEKSLKRLVLSPSSSTALRTALLIGYTVSGSRDHVLEVLPTPAALKGEDSEGVDEGDWWVGEHARQVSGSLPGGVMVLGLAVSCSSAELKTLQPRLRQLLVSVWSSSQCGAESSLIGVSGVQLLAHCCSQTKKIKCQAMDTANSQGGFHPAELKFLSHPPPPLIRLECSLQLARSILLPTATDLTSVGTKHCLKDSLKQLKASVSGSLVSIDGYVPTASDTLTKLPTQQAKSLSRGSASALKIQLYLRVPVPAEPPAPCEHKEGCQFDISGGLHTVAYTTAKSTWGEAVMAVKQDIMRSLTVRYNLLSEELASDIAEHADTAVHQREEGSSKVLQLPRRVLISLSTPLPFLLSDYCFSDEMEQEVKERVCELWSTDPEQTEVSLLSCEEEPSPRSAQVAETSPVESGISKSSCTTSADTREATHTDMSWLAIPGLVVALLVGMMAVLLWWMQNR